MQQLGSILVWPKSFSCGKTCHAMPYQIGRQILYSRPNGSLRTEKYYKYLNNHGTAQISNEIGGIYYYLRKYGVQSITYQCMARLPQNGQCTH